MDSQRGGGGGRGVLKKDIGLRGGVGANREKDC